MKKLIIFLIFMVILVTPADVFAAKKRLRPAASANTAGKNTGFAAFSSAKLRGDRLAIIITFLNLTRFANANYTLTYTTNGVDQGVQGSIPTNESASIIRELLFGTCSKNVCTYHRNIKNMKLTITVQTKSGTMYVKRYAIRP